MKNDVKRGELVKTFLKELLPMAMRLSRIGLRMMKVRIAIKSKSKML